MRLTCCDCGKEYLLEDNITSTIDLKYGNVGYYIKCPHCGLEHLVAFTKVGWKKQE